MLFNKTLTYQLDEYTDNALQTIMNPLVYEYIQSIFQTLDKCNELNRLELKVDLSKLEILINDIITEYEEQGEDEVRDRICLYLETTLTEELEVFGIAFHNVPNLYTINQIITGLYLIYSQTQNSIDSNFINILESDEDNIEIFSELISSFTSLIKFDLYTKLAHVENNVIDDMKEYAEYLDFLHNPDIDPETIKQIQWLADKDKNFMYSLFINNIIKDGYEISKLSTNLKQLYYNLEKLGNNINLITYDIVAVLVLSEDSKDSLLDSYNEVINLESVSHIADDEKKISLINNNVQELISKLLREGS